MGNAEDTMSSEVMCDESAKELQNNAKRQADECADERQGKKTKSQDGDTYANGDKGPSNDFQVREERNLVNDFQQVKKTNVVEDIPVPMSKERNIVEAEYDPEFASLVNLTPVPDSAPPREITGDERRLLERDLQFDDLVDDGWRADWSGNLQLLDKEIMVADPPHAKPSPIIFHEWVSGTISKSPQALQSVRLLLSYVYHMKDTPEMARKILAYSLNCPAKDDSERLELILNAVRRTLYDPVVLKQDGWTTKKALTAEGASGGAYLIGRKIIWEKYDAIVIGFVHDDEIGDLWKAMWVDDRETFDLEADELWSAIKKWENREARKNKQQISRSSSSADLPEIQLQQPRGTVSHRHQHNVEYTVPGIEHGIVLALSSHPNARTGVFWPARVMHVSELNKTGAPREPGTRRGAAKRYVTVVFLAPYWNGHLPSKTRSSGGIVLNSTTAAKSIYSTGPLFEIEMVEPSESTIIKYPFDDDSFLQLDKTREEFKYLGLPKAAFARYLDSHRLALALKNYCKHYIHYIHENAGCSGVDAFAALTDCHQMSIKTPCFPSALLNIPYDYILSQLTHTSEQSSNLTSKDKVTEANEPVLQLGDILRCMSPPYCFGIHDKSDDSNGNANGLTSQSKSLAASVGSPYKGSLSSDGAMSDTLPISHFASDCLLQALSHGDENLPSSSCIKVLGNHLSVLVSEVNELSSGIKANVPLRRDEKKAKLNVITSECLSAKSFGEDVISSIVTPDGQTASALVNEWRKACERIYRRAVSLLSSPGYGNGVTVVITDSRCNQHITSSGCFERPMRIPAAIRGAKRAGAGADVNLPLIYYVTESYLSIAEKQVLPRAHKESYLKRLKLKISSLSPDSRGIPLTDDSDGEGGSDTRGSRGSYMAALSGVAAALQAVDMVVRGECVSAFCATRPPGHHAGRELRAMNAVSNGFCLLNSAACAALYSVTPHIEGGRGLKRVCVIDFDVHHGNGTQDILCSTYDSRFFYVSLHAGGAHINGFETSGSDSEDQDFRRILGGGKQDGIYPGRCGDHSPHPGVLNIPLGPKVTAHAIGTALMTEVAPAVEAFSPDLIILSAGFDAHKCDPMGLGCLSAEDFGSVTDVACQMAMKVCSGRVVSVLEGGYGVPCCQPTEESFIPAKYLDLGKDVPEGMLDDVSDPLRHKLEKCYSEGFMDCVKTHVAALSKSSKRRK